MSEAIKLYDEKEIRQEKRSADEVIMRRALPEDTEAICQIIQQESVYKDTLQYPYRQTEHKRKRLAEFTDHAIFLVAVLEGSVIGEVGVNIEKNPRRSYAGNISIILDENYRSMGIASKMLSTLVELSDNWLGLKRLELTVFYDNNPAICLYEKHGFKVEGRLCQYALRAGKYVDVLTMARLKE
ncbi:GNAT family N-acetyltransferase [Fangia hongkongensis]|uniref:GNAT family N-acetyltransferase n=1 Tax=Fangia hongkongensis TaxID=270495 RepID=UPI000688B31D|nr:GNAT family N-acetyltransferase [Fangia hongkongensis]